MKKIGLALEKEQLTSSHVDLSDGALAQPLIIYTLGLMLTEVFASQSGDYGDPDVPTGKEEE